MYSTLDEQLHQQFEFGSRQGLQFILDTRTLLPYETNVLSDRQDLPNRVVHLIQTLILGRSPMPEVKAMWIPPEYDTVERYMDSACRNREQLFEIGIYKGNAVQLVLNGRVVCWGDGEDDLCGEGLLRVQTMNGGLFNEVKVKVLGSVGATGTAVVMDEAGKVWFYWTENAIDVQLKDFNSAAALVLERGEIMGLGQQLETRAEYAEAEIHMVASDEEDEEDAEAKEE
jgi:hypothetical protein